jgi:hypothetical protein
MMNFVSDKIYNIRNYFINNYRDEEDRLLENISSAFLIAEKDYNNVSKSLKHSIKKSQMLHVMVNICNNLIKNRLNHKLIDENIYDLIDLLKIDGIYLTKFKNKKFLKIKSWNIDNLEEISFDEKFYNDYLKYNKNNDFHRCFNGEITRECVFPIKMNNVLWGTFNIVKYKKENDEKNKCHIDNITDCYWNNDQIIICSILSSVFSSHIKTYKLIDDLREQNLIIEKTSKMIDVFTWTKDINGKYRYCSNAWKKLFFDLDNNSNIIDKSDKELIEDYKKRTGKNNTFYNICKLTDNHCIKKDKTCKYIKIGYIDNEMYIFEIKKSPLYNDNKIIGIVSVAKDYSFDVENIERMVSFYMKKGIIEKLNDDKENNVVAYWIKTDNIKLSERISS